MYGIFNYIWVIFGVNVGKYTIHGASGLSNQGWITPLSHQELLSSPLIFRVKQVAHRVEEVEVVTWEHAGISTQAAMPQEIATNQWEFQDPKMEVR